MKLISILLRVTQYPAYVCICTCNPNTYTNTFAYGAMTSSAVICMWNFLLLVNLPMQVPTLIKFFLATLVALFIIASLGKKGNTLLHAFVSNTFHMVQLTPSRKFSRSYYQRVLGPRGTMRDLLNKLLCNSADYTKVTLIIKMMFLKELVPSV